MQTPERQSESFDKAMLAGGTQGLARIWLVELVSDTPIIPPFVDHSGGNEKRANGTKREGNSHASLFSVIKDSVDRTGLSPGGLLERNAFHRVLARLHALLS